MKNVTRILTLKNGYHLWSHTYNLGAKDKLLCLHGGPGDTHEVFEGFGAELKDLNIEVTMYDQLGSWYSDTPDWDNPEIYKKYMNPDYFLSEVEEVRQLLGYDKFYLAGHSWGGMLSMMYANSYQENLKGLIIISMIDNIHDYVDHMKEIRDKEFTPAINKFMEDIETRGEWNNAEYQKYITHLYHEYINRRQPEVMSHIVDIQDKQVYNHFQGDNEFVVFGDLDDWDYSEEIKGFKIPTLLSFADHETMPLATAKKMAEDIPNSRLVITPNGGHNHMVDNPGVFFTNLRNYFKDVRANKF